MLKHGFCYHVMIKDLVIRNNQFSLTIYSPPSLLTLTYKRTDRIPHLTQFDWVAMFTPHPEDFTEKLMAWVGNRRPTGISEGLLNAHINADRCVVSGHAGDRDSTSGVDRIGRGDDTADEKEGEGDKSAEDQYDDEGYCRATFKGRRGGLVSLRVADVFDTMHDAVTAMNVFGESEH